jgi:nicotinic acid mononucleotide adenylyltransferase
MKRAGQAVSFESCDDRVRAICTHVVEVPQIEMSSTLVRNRVAQGKPIDGLVHPAVEKIIRNSGLYQKK